MTTEPAEPAWKPIPLPGLPPGHSAYQLGPDDDGPVIKIIGINGDFVIGHGATKAEAIGHARAKLKIIGGVIA